MSTLKQVVNLLEDMRPTLERAGISNKFIIFGECDKLPGYCMEDALIWLQSIYKDAYMPCKRIRDLVPENIWQRYAMFEGDFDEHREVVLYKEALAYFKQACRQRPLIFKHNDCLKAVTENARKKPKNKAKKNKDNRKDNRHEQD